MSYEEKTASKEKYLIRHGMCPIIGVGLILVLTILSPALVSVRPADAQTYTISSCGDCHSDPPIDGTRNATTGAVAGSHSKHASSSEYHYDCSVCHVNVTRTPTPAYGHRDGNINMVSPLNAHSGNYNNPSGTTFPQTNTPTLYSCSNTYCHSTGIGGTSQTGESRSVAANTSPTWGNNGTITCNSCHGKETGNDGTGRPWYDSPTPKENSHKATKHASLTCDKCHYDTTHTGSSIFDPAKHADRQYEVVGTGTEPFTFTYTYASTGGGCATGYCHGAAAPAWGTTGTLACASCHSSMGSGGAAAYTGKHQKHVDTTGYDYSCELCHSLVNGTVHVDGPVVSANQSAQVTFRNSTTGAFVTGQTYNGSVSTYKYRSLAHNPYSAEGAVTPAYAPAGTIQTDGSLKWRDAGTCSTVWCHSNANPMLRGAETSLNTYRSVAFNATLGCTACHLGPGTYTAMTTATDRLSTTHARHLATDWYGQNANFTCSTCHTNTASDNATISNIANHVNAAKDVAILATVDSDTTPTNNWASPNCSSVYCHASGDRLGVTPTIEYRTVAWSSTITGCTACHNGPDTYANMTGATGANRMSAAHIKHIATDRHGANTNYTCNACHSGVADTNTVINTTTGYGLHVNKAKNVVINAYGGSGTWSGAPNNNCSTTYCHSKGTGGTTQTGEVRAILANTSTAWTGTIAACNVCHGTESGTTGAPAYANLRRSPTAATGTNWTTPTNVYASDDARAVFSGTTQNYLYITGFGFTTTEVPDGSTIRDITVIIEGNGTSATATERQLRVALTKTGSVIVGTAKSDATTQLYQTSDREIVLGGNNDLWGITWTPAEIRAAGFGVAISDSNTTANALNIDRVRVVVHTDTAPKKNSHSNHAAYACSTCHSGTVSTGNSPITGFDAHVDKTYDVAGANITAYTYNVAGGTCTNACHGGLSGTAAAGVPQWGVSEMDCVACHAAAQGTRDAVVGEFGLAWGHKKSGRETVTNADCIVCHLEGVYATQKTSATYHGNGNIDLRDPDGTSETAITNMTGGAFTFTKFATSYTAGARTSTGHTSNNVDNVLTQKFCLACHDSNGATNTTARTTGGTAFMPWGGVNLGANYTVANGAAAAGGLVDVKTQLATTNSSAHPVLGPKNRDFPTAARLTDPYKPTGTRGTSGTLSQGVVINCFDCHNTATRLTDRTVAAHGNAVTIPGVLTITGSAPAAGTNQVTFCIVCHIGYDSSTATHHNTGSALSGATNNGMLNYLRYACNICHGSTYNTAAVRPVRALDVHGVNVLPTGGLTKVNRWAGASTGTPAQVNARPYAFIRNTEILTEHNPLKIGGSTYSPGCTMGNATPNCSRAFQTFTVGGTY